MTVNDKKKDQRLIFPFISSTLCFLALRKLPCPASRSLRSNRRPIFSTSNSRYVHSRAPDQLLTEYPLVN